MSVNNSKKKEIRNYKGFYLFDLIKKEDECLTILNFILSFLNLISLFLSTDIF